MLMWMIINEGGWGAGAPHPTYMCLPNPLLHPKEAVMAQTYDRAVSPPTD